MDNNDELWYLAGSDVPFIRRPCSELSEMMHEVMLHAYCYEGGFVENSTRREQWFRQKGVASKVEASRHCVRGGELVLKASENRCNAPVGPVLAIISAMYHDVLETWSALEQAVFSPQAVPIPRQKHCLGPRGLPRAVPLQRELISGFTVECYETVNAAMLPSSHLYAAFIDFNLGMQAT